MDLGQVALVGTATGGPAVDVDGRLQIGVPMGQVVERGRQRGRHHLVDHRSGSHQRRPRDEVESQLRQEPGEVGGQRRRLLVDVPPQLPLCSVGHEAVDHPGQGGGNRPGSVDRW